MKKSHRMLFIAVLVCAGILQIGPATAQLKTQTVEYKHGDTALEGYLAYDANANGKRPGVFLIHRRDGMTDFTREHADMIAKLGYVVFAADMFGKGVLPKDVPEMQQATKFEFVINLKAAKQIGLMIPNRVLERANKVIK